MGSSGGSDSDGQLIDATAVPDLCFEGSLCRVLNSTFVHNGRIHTIGGVDSSGCPRKEIYRFEVEKNIWQPLQISVDFPMPDQIVGCSAISGDKLYLICGAERLDADDQGGFSEVYTADLSGGEVEFRKLQLSNEIPQAVDRAFCSMGDQIYCFGGDTQDRITSSGAFRLCLRSSEWNDVPQPGIDLKAIRSSSQLFLTSSSLVVVLGGHIRSLSGGHEAFSFKTLPAYNIATEQWILVMSSGDYPTPRSNHSVCASNCGTFAVLAGGIETSGEVSDEIFIARFSRTSTECVWIRYERRLPFQVSHHSAVRTAFATRASVMNPNTVMFFGGLRVDGSMNEYILIYDLRNLNAQFKGVNHKCHT